MTTESNERTHKQQQQQQEQQQEEQRKKEIKKQREKNAEVLKFSRQDQLISANEDLSATLKEI